MRKLLVNFNGLFDNKEHVLQVLDQFRQDIASSVDGEVTGYDCQCFSSEVYVESKDASLSDFLKVEIKNIPSDMPDDPAWYDFQPERKGL
jgi:hypothetical protein